MEGYQNEFCEEEFYHILENMSPLTSNLNNIAETGMTVAWCQKCKCAPCACVSGSSSIWLARNQQSRKRTNSSPNASEDYSISESKKTRSNTVPTTTRTVGIVEPRVVVKIPLNKIASTKKISSEAGKEHHLSSAINWPINGDSLCSSHPALQSPMGAVEEGSLGPLAKEDNMVCKMRTNGSQSGHIQVDKQTIETALDDEGGSGQQGAVINEGNDKKKATTVVLQRNVGNGLQQQQSPDLLDIDILDNFLITTSNPDETVSNAINQVSHAQMGSSTTPPSSSSRSTESVKFHFEECGSDVDEREWMFCHVPGCSFWTSKSWRMERHKLCHSFETSPLESSGSNKRCYKCPDCHLKFFSLAKLLKHDRKKHTGVKDYECRICGAEVTDIQTHMRIHGDEKNHFCEHCPLSFRHKSSLVRHMFLHTGERPYRCQSCQSAFTARDRLKGHILKHHPHHPAAKEIKQSQNKSDNTIEAESQVILSEERNENVILQLEPSTTVDFCWYTNNHQMEVVKPSATNPLEVAIQEIVQVEPKAQLQPEVSGELDQPISVATVQPRIVPDLSSQMTRLADKLKSLRESKSWSKEGSIPTGKQLHVCPKCGREYKYQSFLHVHLKRKCT